MAENGRILSNGGRVNQEELKLMDSSNTANRWQSGDDQDGAGLWMVGVVGGTEPAGGYVCVEEEGREERAGRASGGGAKRVGRRERLRREV